MRPSVSLQANNGAGRGWWVRILTPAGLLSHGAKAGGGSSSLVGLRTLSLGQCRSPPTSPPLLSSLWLCLAAPAASRPPPSPREGRWEGEVSLANSSAAASSPQLPGTAPLFWKGPTLFFFKIFPEGGSERKKMTRFEDLGILLQNRWSQRPLHPLAPRDTDNGKPQSGAHLGRATPLPSDSLAGGIIEDHNAGEGAKLAVCQVPARLHVIRQHSAPLSSLLSLQRRALSSCSLSRLRPALPPLPPSSKCIFVQLSVSDYESMIMWYKRDRWLLVPSCLP